MSQLLGTRVFHGGIFKLYHFTEIEPKARIFNHEGLQCKTQRSQIDHNQYYTVVSFVHPLCPLWLDATFKTHL